MKKIIIITNFFLILSLAGNLMLYNTNKKNTEKFLLKINNYEQTNLELQKKLNESGEELKNTQTKLSEEIGNKKLYLELFKRVANEKEKLQKEVNSYQIAKQVNDLKKLKSKAEVNNKKNVRKKKVPKNKKLQK